MHIVHSCRGMFIDGHAMRHVTCGVKYEVVRYSKKYGYTIVDNQGNEVLVSWTMVHKYGFKEV
ncbi:hypothetical protein KAMAJI_00040 [Serratia phage vB_SmaM-Kamaji]|nr:hypothetical protein KAMAJI_00040 [Serratia phage vB_SmaM-Kamaji]